MHLFAFSVDLISYLTRFEWDMAKYPIKQPLKNISEALAKVNCTPDFKISAWGSMSFGWLWFLLSWESVWALPSVWAGTSSEAHTLNWSSCYYFNFYFNNNDTYIETYSICKYMALYQIHYSLICFLHFFPFIVIFFFFFNILPYYSPLQRCFFLKLLVWH